MMRKFLIGLTMFLLIVASGLLYIYKSKLWFHSKHIHISSGNSIYVGRGLDRYLISLEDRTIRYLGIIRKDGKVFLGDYHVEGADPETFQAIGSGGWDFYKDKNRVYHRRNIFDEELEMYLPEELWKSDPATFKVVDCHGNMRTKYGSEMKILVDKNNIYYLTEVQVPGTPLLSGFDYDSIECGYNRLFDKNENLAVWRDYGFTPIDRSQEFKEKENWCVRKIGIRGYVYNCGDDYDE